MAPTLEQTALALVGQGRGLLAMDESTGTCNARFAGLGIPQTEPARRAWRELLVSTEGLGTFVSGAILYDETMRQSDRHGVSLVERLIEGGIIPGIKVDLGAKDLALHRCEKVTEGLDGLRPRLRDYAQMGACFAKWRAVFSIGDGLPSRGCIAANANALARYAGLCQEAGLVPIVEPEILMTRGHTLQRCAQATTEALQMVFEELGAQRVMLEGMILKPNMVLPGLACPDQADIADIAEATLACLQRNVPAAVAGIAFLSGGQSSVLASARLNAINIDAARSGSHAPWPLVFSFGRALQDPALKIWGGDDANTTAAQQALLHRARCNHAAVAGEYHDTMEQDGDTPPLRLRA